MGYAFILQGTHLQCGQLASLAKNALENGKFPTFFFKNFFGGAVMAVEISREWSGAWTPGFFVVGWGVLKTIIIGYNRTVSLSKRSGVFADTMHI